MKVEELRKIMESSNVNRYSYSINSALKDDAYHIINENGIWNVFYMERGQKSSYGTFESEEEACKCFHDIVCKHLRI